MEIQKKVRNRIWNRVTHYTSFMIVPTLDEIHPCWFRMSYTGYTHFAIDKKSFDNIWAVGIVFVKFATNHPRSWSMKTEEHKAADSCYFGSWVGSIFEPFPEWTLNPCFQCTESMTEPWCIWARTNWSANTGSMVEMVNSLI